MNCALGSFKGGRVVIYGWRIHTGQIYNIYIRYNFSKVVRWLWYAEWPLYTWPLYTSLNVQPIFKRILFRFVSKTVQRKRMLELRPLAQNLIEKKTVEIDQLMHLYVCNSVSQDRCHYNSVLLIFVLPLHRGDTVNNCFKFCSTIFQFSYLNWTQELSRLCSRNVIVGNSRLWWTFNTVDHIHDTRHLCTR